jgi:ornithine carbamoyltransferase
MAVNMKGKHLLSINDLTKEEIYQILDTAKSLKIKLYSGEPHKYLEGKSLALVFQKPSLRTKVSFDVGMYQLGGHPVYLGPNEIKIGQREIEEDIIRVLSRYVDGVMARVFDHKVLIEFAKYSRVPIINGLSDYEHPCQILGDLLTIREKKNRLEGLKVAYIGDSNNVSNSLMFACTKLGMDITISSPEGYDPTKEVIEIANENAAYTGAKVRVIRDPKEAAEGVDVLYTDVWTSMGEEAEREQRRKDFQGYRIDSELLKVADEKSIILHCLPAHYDEELEYEAARSIHSVIFDQAENRLHAQKAILVNLMR